MTERISRAPSQKLHAHSCVTLADAGAPHERAWHEHLVLHFLKNATGANLSVCDTEHSCFDGISVLTGVVLPDTSLCIKKNHWNMNICSCCESWWCRLTLKESGNGKHLDVYTSLCGRNVGNVSHTLNSSVTTARRAQWIFSYFYAALAESVWGYLICVSLIESLFMCFNLNENRSRNDKNALPCSNLQTGLNKQTAD